MACKIAENFPLSALAKSLGLAARCHGRRHSCIQNLVMAERNDVVLGAAGTALGYCQALFNFAGQPMANTQRVLRLLKEIDAPWSQSHELFWGHRSQESAAEFVEGGIKPLVGNGRVPILITGLDPGQDRAQIETIMGTSPAVPHNETVLVRTILSGDKSVDSIAEIIRRHAATSRSSREMPKWWPLLQGDLTIGQWRRLKQQLGADWAYVNVAINAFVKEDVFDFLQNQITVAQIALGAPEGISSDGRIELPAAMKLTSAPPHANYSLPEFVRRLSELSLPPALIILGPSQPGWSDAMNQDRVAMLLPLLRKGCDELWKSVSESRREEVWQMAA